jgi:hypothetical protein
MVGRSLFYIAMLLFRNLKSNFIKCALEAKKCTLRKLPCNCEVRGHCMFQGDAGHPDNRIVEKKRLIRKSINILGPIRCRKQFPCRKRRQGNKKKTDQKRRRLIGSLPPPPTKKYINVCI